MKAIYYLNPYFTQFQYRRIIESECIPIAVIDIPYGTTNPLEFVFEKCNTITHPWTVNPEVKLSQEYIGKVKPRSMSTGDLVKLEDDDMLYLCFSTGFVPLEEFDNGLKDRMLQYALSFYLDNNPVVEKVLTSGKSVTIKPRFNYENYELILPYMIDITLDKDSFAHAISHRGDKLVSLYIEQTNSCNTLHMYKFISEIFKCIKDDVKLVEYKMRNTVPRSQWRH